MRKRGAHIDRPLALLIALLVVAGALLFASAAFGLLARGQNGMSSVVFNHLVLGVGMGLVAMCVAALIDYRRWKSLAPFVFACAIVCTALVFVPHIGFEHGGGRRWIVLFGFSAQPSELLKIAGVIAAAAYFAAMRETNMTLLKGAGGFLALLAIPATLLILQPDIGTLGVVSLSMFTVYFAAGARARDIALIAVIALTALGALVYTRPYMMDRIATFLDPAKGQQAEGYQIKQALIAIGSGGLVGRGLGQGIQKFTYLPEPMGDSIFAVLGEELGFIGTSGLVAVFLLFALRGYTVAARATDLFGGLLAIGISTYLAVEAFINMAAMLGIAPLTGIPLTFISQGGSAMLVSLASAGILLSISRRKSA